MQEWKIRPKTAGLENARLENVAQKNAGRENAGLENTAQEILGWKMREKSVGYGKRLEIWREIVHTLEDRCV